MPASGWERVQEATASADGEEAEDEPAEVRVDLSIGLRTVAGIGTDQIARLYPGSKVSGSEGEHVVTADGTPQVRRPAASVANSFYRGVSRMKVISTAVRARLKTLTSSTWPAYHSPQMALPPILRALLLVAIAPVCARVAT